MPLANYAEYRSKVNALPVYAFTRNCGTAVAARLMSNVTVGPLGMVTPSTAVALARDTAGNLLQNPSLTATTNPLYLAQCELSANAPQFASLMVIDRLSHQGGLSGTTTGAQTTNLPTAALTRYTTGEGVMAALEIYTAIGTTATTATISYTNQAGTAGQTSKAIAFGGASNNAGGMFFPIPLADGDTGVRAVASVTLAASTVTAGNFGVVLFKPLLIFPNIGPGAQATQNYFWDGLLCGGTKLIEADDNAFLQALSMNSLTTAFNVNGTLSVIEVA